MQKDAITLEKLNEFSKLNALLFDSQTANDTKIQLIKEDIASNAYQINSRTIAMKLTEYAPLAEEAMAASV